MNVTDRFKRNLLTGFAALFPILITVFLLSWLYIQLDRWIGTRVNALCEMLLARYPAVFRLFYPDAPPEVIAELSRRQAYAEVPAYVGVLVGIAAAVTVIYLMGTFIRGYVGGRLMALVDRFFERFPVIKNIYPHARQVADFLFGRVRSSRFKTVVTIEYPRRGSYSIGFLTGKGLKDVEKAASHNLVSVFVPTSPTPLTGFIVMVPPDEVWELDISVEEAFRFCLTAGVLASKDQRPEEAYKHERLAGSIPIVEDGEEANDNG